MATRIQLRRGTAAQWAEINPVLALAEPGFETDTGILRIGDGQTAFMSLTPIVTVGAVREELTKAINALNIEQNTIVENINTEKDTVVATVTNAGAYYTNVMEELAGQLSGFISMGAFMFNTIDGGDRNSVYNASDVIECGNATREYDASKVIDGDNAKTSNKTRLDFFVSIEALADLQNSIDTATSELGVAKNNITTLQNTVTAFNTRFANIESAINDINASIETLNETLATFTSRLIAVETVVDGNA